jgi:hypothetical protein
LQAEHGQTDAEDLSSADVAMGLGRGGEMGGEGGVVGRCSFVVGHDAFTDCITEKPVDDDVVKFVGVPSTSLRITLKLKEQL